MVKGYSDTSKAPRRKESRRRFPGTPDKQDRRIIWEVLNAAFKKSTDYSISKFMPGLIISIDTGTINPFCGYLGRIKDTYIIKLLGMDIYAVGWGTILDGGQSRIASVADPEFGKKVVDHVLGAHHELLSKRIEQHNGYVSSISKVKQAVDTKLGL